MYRARLGVAVAPQLETLLKLLRAPCAARLPRWPPVAPPERSAGERRPAPLVGRWSPAEPTVGRRAPGVASLIGNSPVAGLSGLLSFACDQAFGHRSALAAACCGPAFLAADAGATSIASHRLAYRRSHQGCQRGFAWQSWQRWQPSKYAIEEEGQKPSLERLFFTKIAISLSGGSTWQSSPSPAAPMSSRRRTSAFCAI